LQSWQEANFSDNNLQNAMAKREFEARLKAVKANEEHFEV
jgi:hypothetical protein